MVIHDAEEGDCSTRILVPAEGHRGPELGEELEAGLAVVVQQQPELAVAQAQAPDAEPQAVRQAAVEEVPEQPRHTKRGFELWPLRRSLVGSSRVEEGPRERGAEEQPVKVEVAPISQQPR